MHRFLVAVAVVLMLATPAMAAKTYENPVWEDGAYGAAAPQDGLDLLELRMWEADLRDKGPGVMLRFLMESSSQVGSADELHLNGTVLGTSKKVDVHVWTEDHASWTSDQYIFKQQSEAKQIDAAGETLPYPLEVWVHDLWIFIPLADLGSVVGQRIDGFVFETHSVDADGWKRIDVAPGGYWPLSSRAEFPEPGAVPEANALTVTAENIPSYFLKGAGHHLNATGQWDDGIVLLEISNPYEDTDQTIDIAAPDGAKALGTIPSEVKANTTAYALYQVPLQNESQDLVWDVRSHFGGVAIMQLKLDALPPVAVPEPEVVTIYLERQDPVIEEPKEPPVQEPPVQEPTVEPEPKGKDSPMGAVALVALAAAVFLLRRRS